MKSLCIAAYRRATGLISPAHFFAAIDFKASFTEGERRAVDEIEAIEMRLGRKMTDQERLENLLDFPKRNPEAWARIERAAGLVAGDDE